ncbi:hypothetical protein JK636_19265 [Clostridium sp. YIM B02515]|uniref:Uncharacterized protein n=1 Tax=Clostridium rhizosphaerae TaxID=2803861 RepID=A0ABS1TGW4_9CLOT|nr:hypothetical protein [Clostridium rhizosphaerae]MBL4937851.1 hypothetical protein [Clostridium rhizosphaerae]
MKINERHRAIIEWVVAVVLIVVTCKFSILSYGSFSPVRAHEQSERTFHYGPSKIIKTIDLDKQKIYLCKYKDWFSADTVKKGIVKWYPGDNVDGTPIDYSKQVSFTLSGSSNKQNKMIMKVYGCVNNPEINTILLVEENEANTSRYDLDESKMFIFYWEEDSEKHKVKYLKGLNKDGKIIYEEEVY